MLYVLTPAVTRKLNYDWNGFSYFQKVVSPLYFSSLKLLLLFRPIVFCKDPLILPQSRGLRKLARAPKPGNSLGEDHNRHNPHLRTI